MLHPDLVPWQRKDGPDQWTAIYMIDGKEVANGQPANGVFGSKEILANPSECANPGDMLAKLREEFNGRIAG